MSKFPATGGFKWINPTKFDLNKLVSNNPESCALEVDLEYPKGLHDLHDDCSFTTEKLEIKKGMLPDYQLKF